MRIPAPPPTIGDVMSRFGPDPSSRFEAILTQMEMWNRHDRYLHWDELRRRPPPEGFSNEEWWLGLKLTRDTRRRAIPLQDSQGRAFGFGLPDSLVELLHQIDRRLGFSLDLPDAVVGPEQRDRYVINTLIEESITSSQLEGASTTREVAKEMLRTGRPPRDRSERMILNNYLTMQRIGDLRRMDITPQIVFELQTRVTEGAIEKPDAAGRFRRSDENIRVVDDRDGTILHAPPPSGQLTERMEAMCAFANGVTPDYFIHPVIRAIILHFWLAYDHPFVDGNGRTARALFYWAMLRKDYRLFEFISISQILRRAPVRYARAFLNTETDGNDVTYFILHQADVIREAVQALHDYVARKTGELRQTEECLRAIEDLNHRQQTLLTHALRKPHTRYVIAGHQRSHNVTHQTARDDLFDLVQRGLLTVGKEGRIYVFRAPSNLSAKLAGLVRPQVSPPPDDNLTLPLEMPARTHDDGSKDLPGEQR